MRNLGELWQKCQTGVVPPEEWEYQRYLLVDNIQYFDNEIKDATFDRGLIYDHFGLGNCISSKLTATIIPKPDYDISKNARVELFIRISTIHEGDTPWFPFGIYFVQGRTKESDKLRIECYDAIRRLEIPYLNGTEQINWPVSCTLAIARILDFLEVQLDDRTVLNPAFFVDGPGSMSMRQVLMYIGSMHGGNWYLTEENKLRLVIPMLSGEPLQVITKATAKKIISSKTSTFDKVFMRYGQGDDDFIISGEGYNELSIFNPWATQDMADGILVIMAGYTYNTFDLQSADIDPALELGDTIEVEGVLANLWQVAYSLRMYANIVIPGEGEGGDSSELGGSPGSGDGSGRMYFPQLYWDFNERELRVEQTEREIASIDISVTLSGNAQGQFQLTLMSDTDSEVTIRIYDNGIQQLYTPTIKKIKKGFNQVGIPHSYVRLRAGLHLFTVTMQTQVGYINLATRSVMYSVDLFATEIPPLEYDLRDLSLRQPELALEPTDVYLAAMHAEQYPIVLRTRYIEGRRLLGSDFTLHWEFPNLTGVKELALEFDGIFELFLGDEKYTLVTDDKPYIFWTDAEDNLWCQYGNETMTRVQLASEVLSISVCRGWNSKVFTNQDMGFVVAYVKYDGFVAYRARTGKTGGLLIWENEELLDEAGEGNSSVHVHRLNDYRLGFSVGGCNKHFVTRRTTIGAGTAPERAQSRIFGKFLSTLEYEHKDADNEALLVASHTRISTTESITLFNYPITMLDDSLINQLSVQKYAGSALGVTQMRWINEYTLYLETEPYSLYGDLRLVFLSTSSYVYSIVNGLTSTTAFVPNTPFILEGTPVPMQNEAISLKTSIIGFEIEYEGTEEVLTERDEFVSLKTGIVDAVFDYAAITRVEYDGAADSVTLGLSFIDFTVYHEYVGSEPL